MLSREVPEYPGYDEVVESPKGLMDITTLMDTASELSATSWNEREENFNRCIYGSLNLMMHRFGVTDEERTQLNFEYPFSIAMKEMLGIAFGSPIHPSQDENTNVGSDDEGDADAEVTGPMALIPLVVDDDEPGALNGDGSLEI